MQPHKAGQSMTRNALSLLAILAVLTTSGCAFWHLDDAKQLVRASASYVATPAQPTASLLVVGDSTAVGTGASNPQGSLAGQIGRDHPTLRIVNLSRNGAKFGEIATQLAGSERFDIILIQGGGNDVIRLTGQATLRDDIERAVAQAGRRSDHVIVMPAGNVGSAPFFFPPVSWLMSQRSRTLRDLAAESARAHGAAFVELYLEPAVDPFAQEPERMNSIDHLHPSDDGYGFWLTQLERQAGISRIIRAVAKPAADNPGATAATPPPR